MRIHKNQKGIMSMVNTPITYYNIDFNSGLSWNYVAEFFKKYNSIFKRDNPSFKKMDNSLWLLLYSKFSTASSVLISVLRDSERVGTVFPSADPVAADDVPRVFLKKELSQPTKRRSLITYIPGGDSGCAF